MTVDPTDPSRSDEAESAVPGPDGVTRPVLRLAPVPADVDDRVEVQRAITTVLRAVPDTPDPIDPVLGSATRAIEERTDDDLLEDSAETAGAWCDSCGLRPAVVEVVVPAEAERDSTRAARARLAETSRWWRRVEVVEVFRVCVDCAPPRTSAPAGSRRPDRPRVTVTSTDPAAGLDPADVRWGGVVRIRRSWSELLWPFGFVCTPPLVALDAWLLTGNLFWVIGTAVAAMVTLIAVDHFRDNPDT